MEYGPKLKKVINEKRLECIAFVLNYLFIFMNSALAKEWFQGGTRQHSAFSEWQEANITNRISTAVSWISEQIGQDIYANVFARSEEIARTVAVIVLECVDSQQC